MSDEAAKKDEAAKDDKHAAPDGANGEDDVKKSASDPSLGKSKETITLKVFAPFKMYFEGEAKGISGLNESGPFDILAHHHNFISMLSPCDLVVHTIEGEDQTFRIARGLMHVRDNKVIVFLDV